MAFVFALNGRISLLTSSEHLPLLLCARMLGMHPISPSPAITNFLAPRLYNLCRNILINEQRIFQTIQKLVFFFLQSAVGNTDEPRSLHTAGRCSDSWCRSLAWDNCWDSHCFPFLQRKCTWPAPEPHRVHQGDPWFDLDCSRSSWSAGWMEFYSPAHIKHTQFRQSMHNKHDSWSTQTPYIFSKTSKFTQNKYTKTHKISSCDI